VLTARPANAAALLRAVAGGGIDRSHLTALHARQLRDLADPEVDRLATGVFGLLRPTADDKRAAIEALAKTFREAPLWAYETAGGKAVFDQVCATCHATAESAAALPLGPNLAGSGSNGADYFLEAIIDPNAVVGADYQLTLVTLTDGSVVSGLVAGESAGTLTLRTPTGEQVVRSADIARRERLEASLMPEGLMATLEPRQQIELLKYLTSLR
jgi:putative heme-binding domain-containing protein